MGMMLKAQQPSIAMGPYLNDDFEEKIVRRFLGSDKWTTTALARRTGTYPKKVLRAVRRLNRRALRREGVEPFHFDPATRTWQLELQIVDAKELQ